ncbi:peptidase domain-containing protein [Thecamonas trahens ATCC 50062]|uniref:Peptidase domain-containing protein n=1 Tax=Thecamonas trahens ATCC 50062 TaxID=461836 RepID=A0A0L0DLM4_THETB|nr:peptidase domain-containing protein [Thecamonas trahens ATCC 50062]KNC52946.1 peptidase domain-containing protein [Thecamonas trahens ATCC 50062]|eukprot:XP_013754840.1 peptidase domain-containing protein [Thecamonas trahens ATCC 50062]
MKVCMIELGLCLVAMTVAVAAASRDTSGSGEGDMTPMWHREQSARTHGAIDQSGNAIDHKHGHGIDHKHGHGIDHNADDKAIDDNADTLAIDHRADDKATNMLHSVAIESPPSLFSFAAHRMSEAEAAAGWLPSTFDAVLGPRLGSDLDIVPGTALELLPAQLAPGATAPVVGVVEAAVRGKDGSLQARGVLRGERGSFTIHISHEAVLGDIVRLDAGHAFRWAASGSEAAAHFDGDYTQQTARPLSVQRVSLNDHICTPFPLPDGERKAGAIGRLPGGRDSALSVRAPSVPIYNSKPDSAFVIYLDFDGHTTSATSSWGAVNAEPYDIDGDVTTFSAAERDRIRIIYELIAEDYRPFDITVTTDVSVYNGVLETRRTRCVFTITDSSSHAGGVAYVGVFSYPTNTFQPAWVFTNRLGGGNAKFCGEAGSHEIGHNMGLSHDGTSSDAYYSGHAGWAPIMGVGYYQDLVQWSQGEYAGANEGQDDLSIIGSASNGFGFRSDDHADIQLTATELDASATPAGTGVISKRGDIDWFSISIGSAGPMTFAIDPAVTSPNLDIRAALFVGGAQVAVSEPSDSLSARLTHVGTASTTYHLSVEGVGKGSPTASGYSDYASLGEYSIAYTGPPPTTGPSCGNSVVEVGEQCDPPGGCCSSTCSYKPITSPCSTGRTCDDPDSCNAVGECVGANAGSCTPVCGDGFREGSEECDDGNTSDGDCCSSTCTRDAAGTSCATETCNGECSALGECQTQEFCCKTDAQCDDGNSCTIDSCGSDTICHNDPAAAGAACDDGLPCTGNDVCDGAGVCAGSNECSPSCDARAECCQSTCQCEFGWHTSESCSVGPAVLVENVSVRGSLSDNLDGLAYRHNLAAGASITIRVLSYSPGQVYVYGAFGDVPERPRGLVAHEYSSENMTLSRHAFTAAAPRSGDLFISVFRAPNVTTTSFEIVAYPNGSEPPALGIGKSSASATPSSAVIIGVAAAGILLVIAAIVTTIVYCNRSTPVGASTSDVPMPSYK